MMNRRLFKRTVHRWRDVAHQVRQLFAQNERRVLVVDDDEAIRKLLAEFLHKRGFRVNTAASLEEAEAHLSTEPFDLLLQDIVLPDGDGIAFIPKAKGLQPQLLIVVLTAIGYEEDALREALEQGASAYISKMLLLDQLLLEVRRVLNGSTTLRPGRVSR